MPRCKSSCFDFGAFPTKNDLRRLALVVARVAGLSLGDALDLSYEQALEWVEAAAALEHELMEART